MRAIGHWRHLMSSRVTIAERSALDGYGAATYGAAVTYQAHVQGKRTLVRDATGQEVVSSQAVYLDTATAIQPTARITLSTGDVGSTESFALQPPILAVERRFDADGAHHVLLFLK